MSHFQGISPDGMWLLAEKRGFEEIRRGFYTPVAQDILMEASDWP